MHCWALLDLHNLAMFFLFGFSKNVFSISEYFCVFYTLCIASHTRCIRVISHTKHLCCISHRCSPLSQASPWQSRKCERVALLFDDAIFAFRPLLFLLYFFSFALPATLHMPLEMIRVPDLLPSLCHRYRQGMNLSRAIVPIAAFTTSLSYWSDPINTHRERQAKFVKSNLRSPLPVVVFEEIANVCQAPLKSKHRHFFYRISSFIFMSVQRKKTRETISICHYTYRYLRRLVKAQGKVFVFLAIRFLSPDIFLSHFYLIFISLSLFRYPFSDLKKRHYQIRFFTSVLRPSIVF